MPENKGGRISRRRVLQSAALAAGGLGLKALGLTPAAQAAQAPAAPSTAAGASMIGVAFEPRAVVRVGVIGYGGRGKGLLHDLLGIPGVEVNAVCDLVKERVAAAQAAVEKAGQKRPAGYSSGERDFENLVRRDDLDVVYIPTPGDGTFPWRWRRWKRASTRSSRFPPPPPSTSAGGSWTRPNARAGTA